MENELRKWHRKQAISCFNATWDLIDKKDRTLEDDLNMIHTAHASRYHWSQIGTSLEFVRGEWQISRVYALTSQGASALFHGKFSLSYCLDNEIGDFDLAFAYEAVARAYALIGKKENAKENYDLALKAADKISKKDDKEYFLTELKTIEI